MPQETGHSLQCTLGMGVVKVVSFLRPEDPPEEDLPRTFIDAYVEWAHTVTDAPIQYHKAVGAVILSTAMAPYISLPTRQSTFIPNIWIMLLAGTTITRKSTCLDMGRELMDEVLDDYLLGNDGSPEGLLAELADRDGKASNFHRDEITGFIDTVIHKDYMAGTTEHLTRLYDGKDQKRILRKESIEIKKPFLIIMSGGILSRMQEIVSMEHIRSGFIPRFIMVSGISDPDELRPIGPPLVDEDMMRSMGETSPRQKIVDALWKIKHHYNAPEPSVEDGDGGDSDSNVVHLKLKSSPAQIMRPRTKHVRLQGTPEFWARLETLDNDSRIMGRDTTEPELYCALYDRLKNSIIKVAILICGADLRDKITEEDLQKAIHYGEEWLRYHTDFAVSIEQRPDMNRYEKKMDKIAAWIKVCHPSPQSQTQIMQKFRLRKSEMPDIEATMVERDMITITRANKSTKLSGGKIWYSAPDRYVAGKEAMEREEEEDVGREDEEEGGASPYSISPPKRDTDA